MLIEKPQVQNKAISKKSAVIFSDVFSFF